MSAGQCWCQRGSVLECVWPVEEPRAGWGSRVLTPRYPRPGPCQRLHRKPRGGEDCVPPTQASAVLGRPGLPPAPCPCPRRVSPTRAGPGRLPHSPRPFVAHGPRRPQGGPRRQRPGWKISGRQEERGPAGSGFPAPPPPLSGLWRRRRRPRPRPLPDRGSPPAEPPAVLRGTQAAARGGSSAGVRVWSVCARVWGCARRPAGRQAER